MLSSVIARRSSSRTCSSGTWRPCPALLTSTSTRPKRSRVAVTSRTICAGSRKSVATQSASGSPAARSLIRSERRAASTTFAPRPAASLTVAAPMPDEAPVTMTTVPSSSIALSLLVLKSRERRQLSRRLVVDVEASSEPGRPRGHERHEGCREEHNREPLPERGRDQLGEELLAGEDRGLRRGEGVKDIRGQQRGHGVEAEQRGEQAGHLRCGTSRFEACGAVSPAQVGRARQG